MLCVSSPRSEVVGRPLGALLANDGARVLSVDIDCELKRLVSPPKYRSPRLPHSHRRILKTTFLSLGTYIAIQPAPRGHSYQLDITGMSSRLGCRDQRCAAQGLQGQDRMVEGWLCLCQRRG